MKWHGSTTTLLLMHQQERDRRIAGGMGYAGAGARWPIL